MTDVIVSVSLKRLGAWQIQVSPGIRRQQETTPPAPQPIGGFRAVEKKAK